MCGLVGTAGLVTGNEEKVLQTLLILDSLRGIDSTGIAVIPRNGDVKVAKALGNPYELIDSKQYTQALLGANRCIIGHNRYGTRGGVSKKNAHPFEFDSLVGAHNGTLTSKHRLDDHMKFDVDSEALYNHMDKHGLHSALEHLEGAWALTWWDKDESSINFLRNAERPLYITRNKTGTCLFWASEKWMLEVSLNRHNIFHDEIILISPDMHMSFVIDHTGAVDKPHVVEAKSRAVPFVYTNHRTGQTGQTGPTFSVIRGGKTIQVPINQVNANNLGKELPPAEKKKTLVLSHNDSYVGSKNVRLEILGEGTDNYGAKYYACNDLQDDSKLIRLYAKPNEYKFSEGELITGDIGQKIRDHATALFYYKVVHSSVKLVNPRSKTEKKYHDANGNLISLDDFCTKYGSCAWCSGFVDPDKLHKFTYESGEAICHECCNDKELGQYVRFR